MSGLVVLVLGILAGIIGAVLGLGGGVIMLPASQIFLGLSTPVAIGTTLLAIVFTSFSGALGHYRAGNVKVKSGLYVALGGITGVLAGSYVFKYYLASRLAILESMLGVIFFIMAVKMALEAYDAFKNGVNGEDYRVRELPFYYLVLLGIITGSLTGLLGLGGGFIMVPAMMWMLGLKPQEAAATTLLAMLPVALTGGIIKLGHGFVDLRAALLMGTGTVIGAQIGVKVSGYVKVEVFKTCFAFIFAFLAFDYLSPLVNILLAYRGIFLKFF
ncbi:hypothetical protein SAMN02745221_01071 [Thermosyntropha lipolytica DSM 11003]|uniref:Probable membrane transporter protein n=1 Tax=Thermosyntropha lipolytica DSM 11003 TaxID=1123382 RepID=A0A1M5N159_9FIRM|nr:sulfite exporter TauE/SafE family protein [Thermosyntropha lipolytica]SHG83306.1 hypothetical protein SAMN02745221_01071 [Thermosyntropha lipolytica DSM 11003]